MKKYKFSIILILIIILIMTILKIINSRDLNIDLHNIITKDSKYLVIHSNLLEKKGGFLLINNEGNIIFDKKVNLQDILYSDSSNNYFVFSGSRRNNNILMDKNKNIKTFSFLNEPKYNGVTTVKMYKDKILGIMNGNLLENTYKSLLVLQDKDENVLIKEEIDIWASDIIIQNDIAYIFGFNRRAEENNSYSKIIMYDLVTNKIIKEVEDLTYNQYLRPIIVGNEIFCIARKSRDENNYLVNIDLNTLKLINKHYLDDNIDKIWNVEDKIYAIKENKFVKLNKNLEIEKEYYKLKNESEYSSSYVLNNCIYLYIRNYDENSNIYLGDFIKFNIKTNEIEIIPFNKNKGRVIENVVFLPIDFFN